MIIDDFNFICVAIVPHKANAVLIVDSDAVSPRPVSNQLLQSISGRNAEVVERSRRVENQQFAQGDALKPLWKPDAPRSIENSLRVVIGEASDHSPNLNATRY